MRGQYTIGIRAVMDMGMPSVVQRVARHQGTGEQHTHQNQESGTVLDVRIAGDQGDEEDDNGEDDQDDHEPVHGGGVPVLDLWS